MAGASGKQIVGKWSENDALNPRKIPDSGRETVARVPPRSNFSQTPGGGPMSGMRVPHPSLLLAAEPIICQFRHRLTRPWARGLARRI